MQEDNAASLAIPTWVAARLGHASAQTVAEDAGVDLLHIKGASLDPLRNPARPRSFDADVLVRPSHLRRFMSALAAADWILWCDFDEGSLFEHAASLHHMSFGMLDVHQNFPGLHHQPAAAFDALWAARVERDIAGIPCAAPGPVHEDLIMLLHAARTPGKDLDIENHWRLLDESQQAAVRSAAEELGAMVGLEIALGNGDQLDSPEAELWRLMVDNSDRLGEWRARWRNAHGARERMTLARRAFRVNRFALGQRLGHPPSRGEVRAEWWRRTRAGATSVMAAATRRR